MAVEKEFYKFFGGLVSTWNPCYSDAGQERYAFEWDAEVEAHDVRVEGALLFDAKAPQRVCLRQVLDRVFAAEDCGEAVNLDPLRRLVSVLVQRSGRHDRHKHERPKIG